MPQMADHGCVPHQSWGFHQGGHELRGAASVRQLKSPRVVRARMGTGEGRGQVRGYVTERNQLF